VSARPLCLGMHKRGGSCVKRVLYPCYGEHIIVRTCGEFLRASKREES